MTHCLALRTRTGGFDLSRVAKQRREVQRAGPRQIMEDARETGYNPKTTVHKVRSIIELISRSRSLTSLSSPGARTTDTCAVGVITRSTLR